MLPVCFAESFAPRKTVKETTFDPIFVGPALGDIRMLMYLLDQSFDDRVGPVWMPEEIPQLEEGHIALITQQADVKNGDPANICIRQIRRYIGINIAVISLEEGIFHSRSPGPQEAIGLSWTGTERLGHTEERNRENEFSLFP